MTKRTPTLLFLAAAIIAALAVPAAAAHDTEPHTHYTWTAAMNQTSYWEAHIEANYPVTDVTCTKYEGHNGDLPARYEFGVVKAAQSVALYDARGLGAFNMENPHNPNDPPSWVMKCDATPISTTTTTTSTTAPDTTTTTTTEVPPSSTTTTSTTEPPTPTSTTTSVPEPSTTTTSIPDTTTSSTTTSTVPESSTTTSTPPVSTSTVPTESSTTVVTITDPNNEPPETLPYTGVEADGLAKVALFALLAGGALVGIAHGAAEAKDEQ